MGKIMTITDLSEKLQLSRSTIYKKSEKGEIPCFKLGTALRFMEEEINDYIKKTIYDQRNQNDKFWKF